MWPWGHLAAGYLVYRLLQRDAVPASIPALALAVGTQLPDLIDKPFAWTLPLLPNGRSLGHSAVIALPLLAGLVLLTDGQRRRVALALSTGYLTHLATDALYPALESNWYYVGFLAWPLVPPIEFPEESTGIVEHFLQFEVTVYAGFELLLLGLGTLAWVLDGKPGFGLILRKVRASAHRARMALTGQ